MQTVFSDWWQLFLNVHREKETQATCRLCIIMNIYKSCRSKSLVILVTASATLLCDHISKPITSRIKPYEIELPWPASLQSAVHPLGLARFIRWVWVICIPEGGEDQSFNVTDTCHQNMMDVFLSTQRRAHLYTLIVGCTSWHLMYALMYVVCP